MNLPTINFTSLFSGKYGKCSSKQAAKLRCIINYFDRALNGESDNRSVTIHRHVLHQLPDWENAKNQLCKVEFCTENIEDQYNHLQVDFANRIIGGGVLNEGCVQEEIRFLINTECIVTRLFTTPLQDTECLVITGCERFSSYTGYSDTFTYSGTYKDQTLRDSENNFKTQVVAIDAMNFKNSEDQFKIDAIERELNKAYCGFSVNNPPKNIATGHWGCGAFNGNKELKALIQLMAASYAKTNLRYCTFAGNNDFTKSFTDLCAQLNSHQVCVGDLFKALVEYCKQRLLLAQDGECLTLFEYIAMYFI